MTQIFGDTYKYSMRDATDNEKAIVASLVPHLYKKVHEKTREGVIYTVFGAIAAFLAIILTAPLLVTWFTAILCVAFVLMVAYWTYDIIKCHRDAIASIKDISEGNFMIADGTSSDCSVIRYRSCVDGYIGDSIKTRVEFDIDSCFVEDKNHDRKFLLFTNGMHAYVLSTMPDGTLLISDDVTIHELEAETAH